MKSSEEISPGIVFLFGLFLAGILGVGGGVLDDYGFNHTAQALYACSSVLFILILLLMSGLAGGDDKKVK